MKPTTPPASPRSGVRSPKKPLSPAEVGAAVAAAAAQDEEEDNDFFEAPTEGAQPPPGPDIARIPNLKPDLVPSARGPDIAADTDNR